MKFGAAAFGCAMLALGLTSISAEEKVPLADIKAAEPSIVVELRYAGPNNIAGHAIYPAGTHAFVQPDLIPRLKTAQKFLRQFDYRLKIWDAYRPPAAQRELWRAVQNDRFVANPDLAAGSLHSWAVAVDCTLTDLHGREVQMPTDFDDFTPAAMSHYAGTNRLIHSRLQLLKVAMAGAGFYAYQNEWWHFTVKNWAKYLPPEEAQRVVKTFGSPSRQDL
jgi:D-alanyl-D-alanine dipeptidase